MQNVAATLKGKHERNFSRLFVLFAREAFSAVIFRRGPSKWYQLIGWDTANDTFTFGQWFHGRIYERRSDLSPDGSMLIYFAQKITGKTLNDADYTYAWTAISKPPYLTALALWPKRDCWAGGGFFVDDRIVELNHKPDRKHAHPNHQPEGLKVKLRKSVSGEDDPIYSERLERDGWLLKSEWKVEFGGKWHLYHTTQPELRQKAHKRSPHLLQLQRSISGLDYSETFTLVDQDESHLISLEEASWVDWDQRGRLILARRGTISVGELNKDGSIRERTLIDLNDGKPTPLAAPEWARRW